MIFLVVKVDCSSSVFNIIKSIWILSNIKNKTILGEKTSESAHPVICLLLQVMTSYQENKQPNNLLSVSVGL